MNPALRLTPNTSPFFRSPTSRSPTKTKPFEEQSLRLNKVIGSTTASVNGFDSIASENCFAYTAGATAVVARVNEDLKVTQRFYRTKKAGAAVNSQDGITPWPVTPTPNEARQRAFGNVGKQPLPASPLGTSTREWSDSPTGKTSSAKDRVKAATSVALSPNGKWLAVGQTGYKPAILIFSLGEGSLDVPVATICEHSFGVHALSWSLDSKLLASLGTINDGFLFVWNIDERSGVATLHSNNKVTHVVNDMCWMGHSIVTVGLRFLKVWRPREDSTEDGAGLSRANILSPRTRQEARMSDFGNSIISPRNKPLIGKNSLLNDLLEVNFIRIIPLSNTTAVVCAESGEICVLDDESGAQTLNTVAMAGFTLSTAALDHQGGLHAIGAGGNRRRFQIESLTVCHRAVDRVSRRQSMVPVRSSIQDSPATIALAYLNHGVIIVDSRGQLALSSNEVRSTKAASLMTYHPGHANAILGVYPIASSTLPNALFFTFDGSGQVCFWSAEGIMVDHLNVALDPSPELYGCENELRVLTTCSGGSILIAGDRVGTLSIVDIQSKARVIQVRAHSAEVTDIAISERSGGQLLATAGKDRMVQLFYWRQEELKHLQTMDDHAGAISSVLFSDDGSVLLSCSSDRSVVVRDAVFRDEGEATTIAYLTSRTLALKASPTSMCFSDQPDTLLVATMDRSICSVNFRTAKTGTSFKCADHEGGEAAIMSKILFAPTWNGSPVIAGICSSDKSVRLYTEYGLLLARDYGHTEGVTSAALTNTDSQQGTSSQFLVTVAADSTIYLWDGKGGRAESEPDTAVVSAEYAAPVRKILPIAELSRLRRDKDEKEPQPIVAVSAPSSPQRLTRKSSRMTLAQPPKLEPAFSSTPYGSRRTSMRHRSPSPPSPQHSLKPSVPNRRTSLGHAFRSKSSEDVLAKVTIGSRSGKPPAAPPRDCGFVGAVDTVCRNLRSLQKQLPSAPADDPSTQTTMAQLENELRSTILALSEKSQKNVLGDSTMSTVLERLSTTMMGRSDDRIHDKRDGEASDTTHGPSAPGREGKFHDQTCPDMDAIAGALAKTRIRA